MRLALLFGALLLQLVQANILLPGTAGPCRVDSKSTQLTDKSRVDPYSPKNESRSIVVTSFAPVHCGNSQVVPYLLPKIAQIAGQGLGFPNNTLDLFRLSSFSGNQQPLGQSKNHTKEDLPVIIFSPGLGSSRFLYANLLQEVASMGFAILSIDHPYDAGAVELTDGRVIPMRMGINKNLSQALDVRTGDVRFALDRLTDNSRSIFPAKFSQKLQLDRVVAIGHSLGGATAAQTMLEDRRFVGGVNFDGMLAGPVVEKGLDRPFINFGHSGTLGPKEGYASWGEVWPHLRGYRLQLQLKGAEHMTFSDMPVVLDSAPSARMLRNDSVSHLGQLPGIGMLPGVGSLPGLRVRTILTDFITSASRFFLSGKKCQLLTGPSSQYPELVYMRR